MATTQLPVAQEFMTTDVQTLAPETPLVDVVAFLLHHKVSNAPVVARQPSGERRLLGFLSEQDCLKHLSNEMFFGSPAQPQTAATIMQRHPVCVAPETDAFTLASLFATHGYRHLPVVHGDDFLGIVSRRDILAALDRYYRERQQAGDDRRQLEDVGRITNYRLLARTV